MSQSPLCSSRIISVGGDFDENTAAELLVALSTVPFSQLVFVDVSLVRQFHDCALGMVVDALLRRGDKLQLRGLGDHQERIFRYLGLHCQQPAFTQDPAS